jgi:alkylhydroperoxidase family enzyme
MARAVLVSESAMTPEQQEQFARFPSNLTRAVLLLERRLARALPEMANALRACGLNEKIREAAILRVAHLAQSAYERMQHFDQALKAGWTSEQVLLLETGKTAGFQADVVAAIRFVDACFKVGQVSDECYASIRLFFSDKEIATLVVLVGHYMMVARYVAILGIELDDEPDDWAAEH